MHNCAANAKQHLSLVFAFLGGGLLLLGASYLGVFPVAFLAQRLSADHMLSSEHARLLHLSQWILAFLLIGISPLPLFAQTMSRLLRALNAIPDRFFGLGLALLAGCATAGIQFELFDNIPHVTDATSHCFQAKIFSAGRIAAPLPPCYESFFQHNVVMNAKGLWHTKYPPGQALWLTPGYLLKAPGLMGPLSVAVIVFCFYFLCRLYFSELFSRVGALLLASSPLLLLLGASYMSHTTLLMFGLTGTLLALAALRRHAPPRPLSFGVAGLCWGMAFLTRPQDAAPAFLIFFVLFFTALRKHEIPQKNRPFVLLGLGMIPPAVLWLGWNHVLYGHCFALGYHFDHNPSLTPIIQDSIGFTPEFTWRRACNNMLWTVLRFNKVLFGWPSSLILIPFVFLNIKHDERPWFWLAASGGLILPYAFFSYYGFEYEARYYVAALPFLVILTVYGIQQVFRMLKTRRNHSWAQAAIVSLLLLVMLHSVCYYWPVYLWPRYREAYEQASPALHCRVEKLIQEPALILVEGDSPSDFNYSSGFIYNDPFLKSRILYARCLPASKDCLLAAFPGREVYRARWEVETSEWVTHDAGKTSLTNHPE